MVGLILIKNGKDNLSIDKGLQMPIMLPMDMNKRVKNVLGITAGKVNIIEGGWVKDAVVNWVNVVLDFMASIKVNIIVSGVVNNAGGRANIMLHMNAGGRDNIIVSGVVNNMGGRDNNAESLGCFFFCPVCLPF